MDMIGTPLRLKNAFVQGGSTTAEDYGREIGRRMGCR
jgi:hypothetical protein